MPKRPSFRGKSVTIVCTDLDRSQNFYSELLGAVPTTLDPGTCRWLQLGALTLSLMPNAEERTPAEFPTHAMPMLWLEVDDVAAAREFLATNGAPVEEIDDHVFLVADPDGLLIEVWQSKE